MSMTLSQKDAMNQIAEVHEQTVAKIPAVVAEKAKAAWEALATEGLPAPKAEEYKYTSITKQIEKHFDFTAEVPAGKLTAEEVEALRFASVDADVFVVENGVFNPAISHFDAANYTACSLAEAADQHADLLAAHFAKHPHQEDPFLQLNTAMTANGVFIHVAKNKVVEKPILLLHINDTREGQVIAQPRNMVIAAQSAAVTVFERYRTIGEQKSLNNVVTEVFAEANANVNYYKIEDEGDAAYHVGNTMIVQSRDSVVSTFTMTLNGAMVRNNINFVLDGENITSNMYGLSLLKGTSHVDNHTTVDHTHPNCESNELYKGVYDEKSAGVFNGKIFVREGAQKTNAFQSNKNILLTDDASIDTKPQLEIWADDVKCSHGCTNGQLDPEQLFYLRARGIDKKTAHGMLLYAFAADVLENIHIDALREELEKIIHERAGY
ncbi:Fe-S cluster assembly protein SufD [Persicobacter diffluens]|uniref:Fe-S cluster assembly protein SufD n=1 Tax=Persicobacter diffluens TaxID=981 RepID=A0AAN5AIU5_9BACT|nr:Fe-S cluster assembly protein SufD [Persicobacter diffluens]